MINWQYAERKGRGIIFGPAPTLGRPKERKWQIYLAICLSPFNSKCFDFFYKSIIIQYELLKER